MLAMEGLADLRLGRTAGPLGAILGPLGAPGVEECGDYDGMDKVDKYSLVLLSDR
jgi:hypothetical protein